MSESLSYTQQMNAVPPRPPPPHADNLDLDDLSHLASRTAAVPTESEFENLVQRQNGHTESLLQNKSTVNLASCTSAEDMIDVLSDEIDSTHRLVLGLVDKQKGFLRHLDEVTDFAMRERDEMFDCFRALRAMFKQYEEDLHSTRVRLKRLEAFSLDYSRGYAQRNPPPDFNPVVDEKVPDQLEPRPAKSNWFSDTNIDEAFAANDTEDRIIRELPTPIPLEDSSANCLPPHLKLLLEKVVTKIDSTRKHVPTALDHSRYAGDKVNRRVRIIKDNNHQLGNPWYLHGKVEDSIPEAKHSVENVNVRLGHLEILLRPIQPETQLSSPVVTEPAPTTTASSSKVQDRVAVSPSVKGKERESDDNSAYSMTLTLSCATNIDDMTAEEAKEVLRSLPLTLLWNPSAATIAPTSEETEHIENIKEENIEEENLASDVHDTVLEADETHDKPRSFSRQLRTRAAPAASDSSVHLAAASKKRLRAEESTESTTKTERPTKKKKASKGRS